MISTIEAVCGAIHNFFETSKEAKVYTIEGGSLSLPFLVSGQYFRIIGSKFNDGVYLYGNGYIIREADWSDLCNGNWSAITSVNWGNLTHYELINETFDGAVCPMSVPRAFLELCRDIKEYNESDAAKPSPYLSESISGHYSYTKADASDNDWSKVFSTKLKRWKKVANV